MTARRAEELRRARRRARVAGAAVFVVGLALPVVLFGRVVRAIAADFRLDPATSSRAGRRGSS